MSPVAKKAIILRGISNPPGYVFLKNGWVNTSAYTFHAGIASEAVDLSRNIVGKIWIFPLYLQI